MFSSYHMREPELNRRCSRSRRQSCSRLLLAPLQEQRRLRPKRPRLDLCAALSLNANENAVIRIVGSPERINLDIVCDAAYDVAYDVTVTAYNVQSRTYNIAYDELG
jgi:hypothetical protein